MFDQLNRVERETVVPDAEESTLFRSDIWEKPVKHKESPEWFRNVEEDLTGLGVQDNIHTEVTKLKKQLRKMPNWKSPGPDGVQGYWIKNLNNLHGNIGLQLDRCLQENKVPSWMVTGKTLLCVKKLEKGNAVENFRPITCLPVLWKLLTGIIAEELCEHLEEANILQWGKRDAEKEAEGQKTNYSLIK